MNGRREDVACPRCGSYDLTPTGMERNTAVPYLTAWCRRCGASVYIAPNQQVNLHQKEKEAV